jgi:hypothetical protein
MYQRGLLLALEGGGRVDLVRLLTEMEYSVVIVDDLERALSEIRHLDFKAAIVGYPDRFDPLEFVLNAREISESLPIVVIGQRPGEAMSSALARQRRVHLVPNGKGNLREEVERVLGGAADQPTLDAGAE